jgi:hypothetical protein
MAAMKIQLGEPTVITCVVDPHELVFEDDGETGYLYVLDLDRDHKTQPIVDALMIYSVGAERGDEHDVEILFNEERDTAILFIDDLAQALIDFSEPRFMCRTGFPAPAPTAPVSTHEWDEAVWQSHV